ncbi:putative RNA-directed DNA polymerase from transposon X-element [Bienertia sinuspersici]
MRKDRVSPCDRHYPGTIIQELKEGTQGNVQSDKRTGIFGEALLLELFTPIPTIKELPLKGTTERSRLDLLEREFFYRQVRVGERSVLRAKRNDIRKVVQLQKKARIWAALTRVPKRFDLLSACIKEARWSEAWSATANWLRRFLLSGIGNSTIFIDQAGMGCSCSWVPGKIGWQRAACFIRSLLGYISSGLPDEEALVFLFDRLGDVRATASVSSEASIECRGSDKGKSVIETVLELDFTDSYLDENILSPAQSERGFTPPAIPSIRIMFDDIAEEVDYWNSALVSYILGASPPLEVFAGFTKRMWGKWGISKVASMGKGIYIVRYNSVDRKDKNSLGASVSGVAMVRGWFLLLSMDNIGVGFPMYKVVMKIKKLKQVFRLMKINGFCDVQQADFEAHANLTQCQRNLHASLEDEVLVSQERDAIKQFPTFPMFNMSIKVMVWNVQGVGNKLAGIREVVRINDPTVLVLVETHISGEQAQRICDRIGYTGQTRAEAQGRGYFVFLEDGAGDAIYASPDTSLRKELWDELERVKDAYSGPWLLAGDFNETLSMNSRIGCDTSEMQRRFEEAAVRNLPKAVSDHCPILISTTGFAPLPMAAISVPSGMDE